MPRFNKFLVSMMLMCILACSVFAGNIECTGRQASVSSATTTGDMSTAAIPPGEVQATVTSTGHIDCGITVILERFIENLLRLS